MPIGLRRSKPGHKDVVDFVVVWRRIFMFGDTPEPARAGASPRFHGHAPTRSRE